MSNNARIGAQYASENLLKKIPDHQILVEAAVRRGVPLSQLIKPFMPSQARMNLEKWKFARMAALNPWNPNMIPMYELYDDVMIDLMLSADFDNRILFLQQAKFNLVDNNKQPDLEAKKLLDGQWFLDFKRHAMMSMLESYSLVEFYELNEKGFLTECKRVNKYNVRQKKGIVVEEIYDDKGPSYVDGPYAPYYLGIGDTEDLGMLFKITPVILAIKSAIGQWGEYDEKLGIPFRWVTSNSADAKRQKQLGVIMEEMGSAGWAVLNENEKIELLDQAGTDPFKCFESLIALLDARVATYILGQSSTSSSDKNKGTYGSLEVLQNITKTRYEADLTFFELLFNEKLKGKLVNLSPAYKPLENLQLEWDRSVELSPEEVVNYTVALISTNKYRVPAAFITQKTGIPVEEISEPAPAPEPPQPPAPAAKKKSPVSAKIKALYSQSCCTAIPVVRAEDAPSFDDDVLRVARAIFDGKQKGIVDPAMIRKTAEYLLNGITTGYGKATDQTDKELIGSLTKNVQVFSGFKNYQQLREITDLLKDEKGNSRPWNDFKKEVLARNADYNQTWLKTEFDNAHTSAQMGSYWQEIQRNKDTLPYLKFVATEDNRTTQICRTLDGVTLPVDDPFWNEHMLPLHWHERSLIQQVASGSVTSPEKVKDLVNLVDPQMQPMFKNNVGKTGVAFPETHPYFEASTKDKKEVNKALDKIFVDTEAYKPVYKGKNGGSVEQSLQHNPEEVKPNLKVSKLLADNGHKVKLLPYSFAHGVKNPDASIDGAIADFKAVEETTHTAIQGAIKKASKQTATTVVISLPKIIDLRQIIRALIGGLGNTGFNKNMTAVWFIKGKKLTKITRAEIVKRSFTELEGL